MKDIIATGTIAGIVGSTVIDFIAYLSRLGGLNTSTPWDVASLVFLNARYLGTASGYIIGIIGSIALGIAGGVITAIIIKITGSDYAWLKGVLVAETIGFAGLGFFAPLLGFAGFLRFQPTTNIFAVVDLCIFGLIVGYVIKRYAKIAS